MTPRVTEARGDMAPRLKLKVKMTRIVTEVRSEHDTRSD